MNDVLKMLLAYGIIMFGPPIATYMYIKNANKLIASASNALSKAAGKLGSFIGSGAQKRFKRSEAGVAWNDRERGLDNQGLTEGREKLKNLFGEPDPNAPQPSWLRRGARNAARGVITSGMSDRTKRNFTAQLAGQDNEIYRGEVGAYKTELNDKYSEKVKAKEHFWKRMAADDISAAETHALHDHMVGLEGGASWMDDVWTGKETDGYHNIGYYIKRNKELSGDAGKGVQKSLLSDDSKFKGGSADASYAIKNFWSGYVNELANSDPSVDTKHLNPVQKFLNQNWTQYEYERDASGNLVRDPKDNSPKLKTDAGGNPIKKTVTFTDMDGVNHTEVLVDVDYNGGLDYTDDRPKNVMRMGSRMARVQDSFNITENTARTIDSDPGKSQIEHVVSEVARRRVEEADEKKAAAKAAAAKAAGGTGTPPTTP